jgi:hypothetical protein
MNAHCASLVHRPASARSLWARCGEGVAHGDKVIGRALNEWRFLECRPLPEVIGRGWVDGVEGAFAAPVANFRRLLLSMPPPLRDLLRDCGAALLDDIRFLPFIVADLKALWTFAAHHFGIGHVR